MNELILEFAGKVCHFDLYEYRCDKYTQEVIAYINVYNLAFIYDAYQYGGCTANFIIGDHHTNFTLTSAVISEIYDYDDFVQINLHIDDISQYTNHRI